MRPRQVIRSLILLLLLLAPATPLFAQTPTARDLVVPVSEMGDGWHQVGEGEDPDHPGLVYRADYQLDGVAVIIFLVVIAPGHQEVENALQGLPQQLQAEGFAVEPHPNLGDGTAFKATRVHPQEPLLFSTLYLFRIQQVLVQVESIGLTQDSDGVGNRAWENVGRQHDRIRALLPPPAEALPPLAPFCPPGQGAGFPLGFAILRAHIGDVMGEPTECVHQDPNSGAYIQQTTTGLAEVQPGAQFASFTNGWDHWALTEQGLLHWTGPDSLPPDNVEILPLVPPNGTPPELQPAMDLLRATPAPEGAGFANWAEMVEAWLAVDSTRVIFGSLSPTTYGVYIQATKTLILTPDVMADSPAAIAAILVHEARHAAQLSEGDTDCIHREVNSFGWQARVWDALTGGTLEPTTPLQAQLNVIHHLFFTEGEPGLYVAVATTPSYQSQCNLWTPT